MTTVALDDVTKVFPDGTVAVDALTLDVAEGEFMVLLGPSGCGKSTVLRMIAGLEEPTSGTVLVGGVDVGEVPPPERGVAMVFQSYALYPHMSVGANIGFPLKLAGVDQASRAEQVGTIAGALGIADLLERRPLQLSGGQRQRVAMGRAIMRQPRVFLMDEPLSNLDLGLRAELRAEISNLVHELGATCIYVTHDHTEALTMADRIAILRHGVLQDVGTPAEVYERPATLYVATFLGSPRMCLVEADVFVHLDSHVALHLGEQTLNLPWRSPMVWALSHYHGERITVGMRPEALVPVRADDPGPVLRGHIRYVEHHGHETLAFLDIGAVAPDQPDVAAGLPPAVAPGALRRLAGRLSDRWRAGRPDGCPPTPGQQAGPQAQRPQSQESQPQRPQAQGPQPYGDPAHGPGAEPGSGPRPGQGPGPRPGPAMAGDAGRHVRRPAELVVRTAPYSKLVPGQPMDVTVRPDLLHLFDSRGRRIDANWR